MGGVAWQDMTGFHMGIVWGARHRIQFQQYFEMF
jgi:hypothetical protein